MSDRISSLRKKNFLIDHYSNEITGSKLPSNIQVLRTLFFNLRVVKLNLRESAKLVVKEVVVFWEKVRIPTRLEKHCISKVESLYEKWRKLQKDAEKTTQHIKDKRNEFTSTFDDLFDIAHADALQMIKIESDRQFLIMQRKKGRPGSMYGIDKVLYHKERRAEERQKKALARQEKSAREVEEQFRTTEIESSSKSSFCSTSPNPEENIQEHFDFQGTEPGPSQPKRMRGHQSIFTSKLIGALDKCKISDRDAVHIVTATAEALGHDVNNLIINRSSIQRYRQQFRQERAGFLKEQFKGYDFRAIVLHWDGKLLPSLTGKDIVDRLAVVISNKDDEKILAIPPLEGGTAKHQASAIYNTLIDWNLQESIKALSFDTTAVNTGHLNGTCLLLEQLMDKDLLYLPCRHHIFEIVLRSVFDGVMGKSTGKDVPIFKRFQQSWKNINTKNFKPGIENEKVKNFMKSDAAQILQFVKETAKHSQPRDDYSEFLELTATFLGDSPTKATPFRPPGAIHHARWMAKAIYSLKIFLFREEFSLKVDEENSLCDICIFLVKVYVKAWFCAPSAAAAPYHDLQFVKKLYDYRTVNAEISKIAFQKFRNHLWYLSPEPVAFAFFDENVSLQTKRKMISYLLACEAEFAQENVRLKRVEVRETAISDFFLKGIEHFITSDTRKFFKRFELEDNFLQEDPLTWSGNNNYIKALEVVTKLRVVNDTAERGIKLIEDYNKILTKNEEQKQFVLQVVSDYRRQFPDSRKQTLLKKQY